MVLLKILVRILKLRIVKMKNLVFRKIEVILREEFLYEDNEVEIFFRENYDKKDIIFNENDRDTKIIKFKE